MVDVEPENAVNVEPTEGNLGTDGSTLLHFRQSSTSASAGKISCKVFSETNCFQSSIVVYM